MPTQISGDTGVSQVQDGAVSTDDLSNLAVTPEKLSQKLTLGAVQATTSGTSRIKEGDTSPLVKKYPPGRAYK